MRGYRTYNKKKIRYYIENGIIELNKSYPYMTATMMNFFVTDLLIDLGYQVIIVEIDENQHDKYDSTCENKKWLYLEM